MSVGSMSDQSLEDSNQSWKSSLCNVRNYKHLKQRLRAGDERVTPTNVYINTDKRDESPFENDLVEIDKSEVETTNRWKYYINLAKIIILLVIWAVFTILLMVAPETEISLGIVSIPAEGTADYDIKELPKDRRLGIELVGPFESEDTDILYPFKAGADSGVIKVQVHNVRLDEKLVVLQTKELTKVWILPLSKPINSDRLHKRKHVFELSAQPEKSQGWKLRYHFISNEPAQAVALQVTSNNKPITSLYCFICVTIILSIFLIIVGFDILHRTFAVIFITTLAEAIIATINRRPDLTKVIDWLNTEELLVIFGVTVLIAVTMETGIFDYLGVKIFQMFNGHIWPAINFVIVITLFGAMVFDNMCLILIIGPLCLRLCEVMDVHPVPVLITMIIFTNIGATVTPYTDHPNIRVAFNPYFNDKNLYSGKYFLHMLPGTLIIAVQTYIQIRLNFRNIRKIQFKDSPEVTRLRRIITAWKHAALAVPNYSKDEQTVRAAIVSKVRRMRIRLNTLTKVDKPADDFQETLKKLKKKYPIRNKVLLIKALISIAFTLSLFVFHLMPSVGELSLGWSALLGATLLLILADMEDMESILAHVQWCSLLFIGCFFVLNELFNELGFFQHIGEFAEGTIKATDPDARLIVAALLIVWLCGILSTIMNSKLIAGAMLHATIMVSKDKELPWLPLVFALAFGSGLGSNGTIIAASANVVGIGIAEQHGYAFYFWYYLKIAFPIVMINLVVVSIYLMIISSWN